MNKYETLINMIDECYLFAKDSKTELIKNKIDQIGKYLIDNFPISDDMSDESLEIMRNNFDIMLRTKDTKTFISDAYENYIVAGATVRIIGLNLGKWLVNNWHIQRLGEATADWKYIIGKMAKFVLD